MISVVGRYKECIAALLALMVISRTTEDAWAQVTSHGDLAIVCRAAVAAMMGHDIKIVRLDKIEGDIAYVSYARPSDKKVWKNRCRLDDSTVIWSTIDAFGPGTGFGPWRDRPGDEKVTFRLNASRVTVVQTFADGSDVTKNFPTK